MNKKNTTQIIVILCAVIAAGSITRSAEADTVTDWNLIATQSVTTAGTAGYPFLVGLVDIAAVHGAIHDSVQAFDKRFEPYCVDISGATGSQIAAAARAARDVLVNSFPAQTAALDMQYNDFLTANGLLPTDPGVVVGQQAAACLIALRANDGRFPPNQVPFIGSTEPGQWRPTPSFLPGPPPSLAPGLLPWFGAVKPFTLNSGAQFRGDPPPPLTSKRYTKDYNEVKALGSSLNSSRTPEQTELANFWDGPPNIPLILLSGVREIATLHINNLGDSARLFALVAFSMADSFITTWDSKYVYNYWRPITAIQEGDADGNRKTIGDLNWQPHTNTPNYPDYSSGANGSTGAVTRTLKRFFGTDKMTFTLTSNSPTATQHVRTYNRFSDLSDEVVDVRIYQGIHFRTADKDGRTQGRRIADWAFKHFLRPLEDDAETDNDE